MQRLLLATLGVGCFVVALASAVLTLYYFFFMLGSVRPEKKRIAGFLGPLVFLVPQAFDDGGNKARIRTLFFAILFGLCFGGLALFHDLSSP